MPKLKPVTDAELEALNEAGFDVLQTARDYESRIGQGYAEPITEALRKASGFLSASRAFADLAHAVLSKAQLAEQKRELENMLRERE